MHARHVVEIRNALYILQSLTVLDGYVVTGLNSLVYLLEVD